MSTHSKLAVDHKGVANIVRERGVVTVLDELVQNALDLDDVTTIDVTIESVGRNRVRIVVVDDDPVGYTDLSDIYTMFGESSKKTDASKRGYMNVGDKLCVAFATEGRITSTTGSVIIEGDKRRSGRNKTTVGSIVDLTFPMTRKDVVDLLARARQYLVADDKTLTVNGVTMPTAVPVKSTKTKLTLYIGEKHDAQTIMRERERLTGLDLYEAGPNGATVFVLGIPVEQVDGLPYSVDVKGRLKADMKRDTIPPAQLRRIKTAVADLIADELDVDDVNTWARDTMAKARPATVQRMIELRHGHDAVVATPGDREANSVATEKGSALIPGGSYSAEEWAAIHAARAANPEFLPTSTEKFGKKNFAESQPVPEDTWSDDARRVIDWAIDSYHFLYGTRLFVEIVFSPAASTLADHSDGHLRFNVAALGWDWFAPSNNADIIALVCHELGHFSQRSDTEREHGQEWGDRATKAAVDLAVAGRLLEVADSEPENDEGSAGLHLRTRRLVYP